MTEDIHVRFDKFDKKLDQMQRRFEERLDKLQEAVVRMAVTEDRVAIVLEQNSLLFKKVDELTKRISLMERENAGQSKTLGFFERLAWFMAAGVASVIGWKLKQ